MNIEFPRLCLKLSALLKCLSTFSTFFQGPRKFTELLRSFVSHPNLKIAVMYNSIVIRAMISLFITINMNAIRE
jgi:hypothetical protein